MVMSESQLPVPGQPDEQPEAQEHHALPERIERYNEHFLQRLSRMAERFDRWAEFIAPRNEKEAKSPENISRGAILSGLVFTGLLGICLLISLLAPLDSAAIAVGKVVLDSNTKNIDHLEGGIVEEILVREGQQVEEGQPLIRLDKVAALARLDLYQNQFVAARATEARLLAERDTLDEVVFPPELQELEADHPQVASNMDAQRRLFVSRRDGLQGKTDVMNQQIKQSEEEISGLEKQIASSSRQLALLEEEIRDVRTLRKTGDAPKTRLLALERRQAEIQGEKGERTAMIARAKQRINEAQIQIYNLQTEFQNDVVGELKETQVQIADLEEQLRAAKNVFDRIEIRAPIGGQITGLAVHTVGGVIAPGETIMRIVPQDDLLIIEAHVSPQDIDVVHEGLMARVRLSAYKTRKVPLVEGQVTTVSGDRFENERTGETYYTARITVDEEQLAKLEDVKLTPGMPAEVLIVTGSRTLFSYLTSPIRDSFTRAIREQ
jgi:HlyD family type I secretion membrane fusion protein